MVNYINNIFVKADNACDYIPVISTFSNLADLIQKYVIQYRIDQPTIDKNNYYTHLTEKETWRSTLLLIPGIGNLIIAIYDLTQRKYDNINFMLAAVRKDGMALEHASRRLKNNAKLVLTAVKQNWLALQHASNPLKNNQDFVLPLIRENRNTFTLVGDTLNKNRQFILAVVQIDGLILEDVSDPFKNDEEVASTAFQQNHEALEHVGNELKNNREFILKLWINKVIKDPDSFQNLSYDLINDEDITAGALEGCKTSEQATTVINSAGIDAKSSKKVARALIKIDPTLLGLLFLEAKSDDIVIAALKACKSSEQTINVIIRAGPNALSSKKVARALIKIDPTLLALFFSDVTSDEDIVIAALKACKSSEQATKVMSSAFLLRDNKKVALALIKIDPTLLELLFSDVTSDEDIVIAALKACESSEQATKVMSAAYTLKDNKKVALALVKIDPTLLEELYYDVRNDLEVVLLAIKLSTEHTIDKIWSFIGIDALLNKEVKAKVKEKYPNFFPKRTFDPFATFLLSPKQNGLSQLI